MATTARQVLDVSLVLMGEIPINGVFDTDRTVDYVSSTPYILTTLQNEVARDGDYFKTNTITVATAVDTAGHYIEHTMPSDFYKAKKVIFIKTGDTYESATDYKWGMSNILLVPDDFVGTIKVIYYPIPIPITAITDTLVLDDTTCLTTLANGLASQLLLTENPDLANYLYQRYVELKSNKRIASTIESIKDVYDSKLNY